MNTETMEAGDKELAELKDQIEQASESSKEQAALEPSPVIEEKEPVAPEPPPVPDAPIAQPEPKAQKDPMKWAEEKGYKTPEDMARALLQKEQAYHESRQKETAQVPPPPAWQPTPVVPQYQPQYQPQIDPRRLAQGYDMEVNDFERVARIAADMSQAVLNQERQRFDQRLAQIERTSQRNNELMTLMQDPAFRDNRVQKEIHQILDSDPSIFQRERQPMVHAFKQAMETLYRRQLQQGVSEETTPRPPVTAGGGNGSANTVPYVPTEREINGWTAEQLKTYMNSNGKIVPKR